MTALLERPRPRTKSAGQSLLNAGLPQVNLLPPEVNAARGLRRLKRMLAFVLLGVVGVCALMVVYGLFDGQTAKGDLARAEEDARGLQRQLAEPKYAEVPKVMDALDGIADARPKAMATDVSWSEYVDAIAAVLPKGASIDDFSVTYATPMSGVGDPADPLQAPSLGQIAFTGRSVTVPDTAAWIVALNSIHGFNDAWVASAAVTGDQESGEYYRFSSTVQVSRLALTHRFDDAKADGTKKSDDAASSDDAAAAGKTED